jgi:hypothetical protein
VTLWNRCLSQTEIRTLRHQTKTDAMLNADANLIGYYQFNNIYNDKILNKKGGNHAVMNGGATLTTSSAPVGNGTVQRMTLNGGGEYNFATAGAKLLISNCTDADGEMYVTRIEQTPFLPANTNANTGNYWIINHYDETSNLSPLDSIELTAVDANFTTNLGQTSDAILHLRSQHSDLFDWQAKSTAKAKSGNVLKFGASNNIDGATQIFITDGGASFTETNAQNYCEADTLPMTAASLITSSSYIQTPDFNETVTNFTVSAWVKPNGIQDDYASVLMNDATGAGLNFRGGNNTLGYHWPGGAWWWNSGLIVPVNEWSHVAMVVTPTSVTLYLNGVAATHTTNTNAETLGTMKIGSYHGWTSRNFDGEMDEVAIWKRALSKDEIRLMRHLTKDKIVGVDADLMAYYQFNETSETAFDKSGNQYHAAFNNSTLKISTAPVAGGVSQKINITTTGQHNFNTVGVKMTFNTSGTTPNGDVIVSRLHHSLNDSLPTTDKHLGYYWIVNNYGTNASFTALDELQFTAHRSLSADFADAAKITFYKRASNQHLKQWATMCSPTAVAANVLSFNSSCNITGFSQLHLMAEPAALPVELLRFDAENIDNEKVRLTWESANELNFSHYEVERSTDGANFEKINEVQPNSTLNYEIFDNQPFEGYNYYRLKMVDLDNSFQYSDTESVLIENKITTIPFGIFPNPIGVNTNLTVNLGLINNGRLRIYTASGKLVKDFILNNNQNEVPINGLSSGTYLYSIQTENQIWNGRLIVIE